jgi:hypothetical protein
VFGLDTDAFSDKSSTLALPYTEHMKLITIYKFKLIFSGLLEANVVQTKEV